MPAVRHGSPTAPRESILDAARTAFARKGFSGVTIRDITDLAPVTRANFYYYFSDKTELFIELGTDTYREALAVVEGFMEQGSPPNREDIEAWVARYFSYLDRNGAFVIRSAEDMPPDRKFRAALPARTVEPPPHSVRASQRSHRPPIFAAGGDRAGGHGDARALVADGSPQRDPVDDAPSGADGGHRDAVANG